MFDYRSVVSDADLLCTFERDESNPNGFNCLTKDSHEKIGYVTVESATFYASNDDVFMQYKLWQTRPERKVGNRVEIEGKNIEELIEAYEELLIGAYILSRNYKVQPAHNLYEKAIDWLRTTDFYTAPASTKYHDAVPGGLLVHSLRVYNQMVDLLNVPAFSAVNVAEATIACLLHDWCKISYYEQFMRNVKDESTGEWHKEPSYKVNQNGISLGHGVTSMYLASRIVPLSVEQCLAIRWHMGRWSACEPELSELQKSNSTYPMVYLIQFADQLACTEYTK